MLNKMILSLAVVFATLLGTQAALAGEQALEPARLVVYRAEEASKTRKLKLNVRLDKAQIGRLKYDQAITTSVSPGQYSLDTSLSGSNSLQLNLKAGQTYFVRSHVKMLGGKVTPVLELVEEQVALEQQPAVSSFI